MSRPLELTIYPRLSPFVQEVMAWNIKQGWEPHTGLVAEIHVPGLLAMEQKRLTEAELAAEWHANEVEAWRMVSRRPEFYNIDVAEKLEARESTLRRFATHPHYFEATEPESDTE